MIGGFERPSAGTIFIRGTRSNDVPPYKRDTNMVFQQLALFPHLNVYENVAFGLRAKHIRAGEIGPRVDRALDLVALAPYKRRAVRSLSGGQQQRVAIARALVNEPTVLLLDEPLGALDLKLRTQMQLELKSLQRRIGTTFIYVTHDQIEALTMSDRIAVMKDGGLEQIGSGREIYDRPATAFVAGFIGDTNLLEVVRSGPGRYATSDGSLTVGLNDAGHRATVSLRPERIRAGAPARVCAERATGRVVDTVYVGADIQYVVAIGGTRLTVKTRGDQVFSPGEEIELGWQPPDAVVVEAAVR
jgi:ABC-type Fe3+/spermidine/putrescine transport system ATPase subunit